MKLEKKNLAMGLMAGVVIGGATLGTIGVSAQQADQSLADRLADRFSISGEEVQTEIDAFRSENKQERQAERQAARAEYIAGLVADGTLTQEQADAFTELKDDFKAEISALKDSDAEREEIKAAYEAAKEEIQAWADAEGIDLDSLKADKGEGRGHGRKGFGSRDSSSDSVELEATSQAL